MKAKTRVAKKWYHERELPVPKKEFWPTNFDELSDVMALDLSIACVGDGKAVTSDQISTADAVVRTEKLNALVSFDNQALNARVMCGMTWGTFKQNVRDRGASVSRFRLYPERATIGGILAASSTGERAPTLWSGSLTMQCVGLNTISKRGVYHYIGAPRKSSGPDLRAFGFGGIGGMIRDATIDLFAGQPGVVWSRDTTYNEAAQICREVWLAGWRPSWTYWSDGEIKIAFHGPEGVMVALKAWIAERFQGNLDDDVVSARDAIESKIEIPGTALRRYSDIGADAVIVGSSLHGMRVVGTNGVVVPKWCDSLFAAVSEVS